MAQIREVQIPINFETGVNALGYNFSSRNIAETLILTPLVIVVTLIILLQFDLEFNAIFSIIFMFAVATASLSLIGINNDPLSVHLWNMIRSFFKKRTAYFNPRVKFEAKSLLENEEKEKEQEQQYKSIYQKYRDKFGASMQTKEMGQENIDFANVVFEDDIGIVDKPIEEMTARERKQFEKAQKLAKKKEKQAERKRGFKLNEIFKKKPKEHHAAKSRR